MADPCHYCGSRAHKVADLEACLRDTIKRENLAYKCLARSYEELMKIHDLEHAMIARLIKSLKCSVANAGIPAEEALDIIAAEELLERHLKAGHPKQQEE